jgi:hypothetical protein
VTAHVPTLLVLTGTALTAVAIFAPHALPPPSPAVSALLLPPETSATWVQQIDPAAFAFDARARVDLIDALAAVGTPWADAVLRQASSDDPDARVRAAAGSALSSNQSLVT